MPTSQARESVRSVDISLWISSINLDGCGRLSPLPHVLQKTFSRSHAATVHRVVRRRVRHPPRTPPWHPANPTSCPGRSAGTKSPDGQRPHDEFDVFDSGSRQQVPRPLRCRIRPAGLPWKQAGRRVIRFRHPTGLSCQQRFVDLVLGGGPAGGFVVDGAVAQAAVEDAIRTVIRVCTVLRVLPRCRHRSRQAHHRTLAPRSCSTFIARSPRRVSTSGRQINEDTFVAALTVVAQQTWST